MSHGPAAHGHSDGPILAVLFLLLIILITLTLMGAADAASLITRKDNHS